MKQPYDLPESERFPLRRYERDHMEFLLWSSICVEEALKQIPDRVACAPDGKRRLAAINGLLTSLIRDIAGTIPEKQRKMLWNLAKDKELRIVPKLTPAPVTATFTKDVAMELVDAAQTKCKQCAEFNEDSEKCKLRQLLEVVVPLNDYGGLICPYSKSEWEEDD